MKMMILIIFKIIILIILFKTIRLVTGPLVPSTGGVTLSRWACLRRLIIHDLFKIKDNRNYFIELWFDFILNQSYCNFNMEILRITIKNDFLKNIHGEFSILKWSQ